MTIIDRTDAQQNAYDLPVFQLFRIDALRVVNRAVPFLHTDTLGSGPVQISHRVQTNVAQSLNGRIFNTAKSKQNESEVIFFG